MNLLDEDIGDYSDSKTDEYDIDQSIDDLGTISIDFTEDNPVTINQKDDYNKCNNNRKKLSDINDEQRNLNTDFENSSNKTVSLDISSDQDEENGDIVAKLLDPFEQLEREFHWDEVTTIKPPPAFSGSQKSSRSTKNIKSIIQSSKDKETNQIRESSIVSSNKLIHNDVPSKR